MKILLLQMLTLSYPLLATKGVGLDAPLGICVQNERCFRKVVEALDIFGLPPVKALTVPPKEMQKAIAACTYGTVITRFAKGRYTEENLQFLLNKSCEIEDKELPTLYIIISVGGIPTQYADFVSGFIYLEEEEPCISNEQLAERWLAQFIRYLCDKEAITPNFVNLNEDYSEQEGIKIFKILSDYLLEFAKSENRTKSEITELIKKVDNTVQSIAAGWDSADDPLSYAEAFRRMLFAATEWLLPNICDRREVNGDTLDIIKRTTFFDEDFYYLQYEDFREICSPLAQNASLDYLKQQLKEAGVLVAEGKRRRYWTKEIELVTVYGAVIRKRLVKIKRSLIDRAGEPTFREILEMKGDEERHGEYEAGENSKYLEACEDCRGCN